MTPQTHQPPFATRFLYATPFLGRIAKDIAREPDSIYYALVIFITALILAIKTWGIVALAMTALAAVPVVFALLLLITRG